MKIYDLLPLLNEGYVAMDWDGDWYWYRFRPVKSELEWNSIGFGACCLSNEAFTIEPSEKDWTESLIYIGGK